MYRGIWRRAFAYIIDVFLLIGLFAIVAFMKDTFCSSTAEVDFFTLVASLRYMPLEVLVLDYQYTILGYLGVYVLIWLLYECCFLYLPVSATPGKNILGLEISFHKKSVYNIFLRTIIKICLIISILGLVLEFLFVHLDKKGRSVHDFAVGSQLVRVDDAKGKGLPKGLWFYIVLALVSLIPYYFVHKEAQANYTGMVYSEVIGMDSTGRELYEGIWIKGKEWTLTFTFLSNKLYIHDSTYFFKDFTYQSDHILRCTDRDGNSYLFERNGARLIVTQTEPADGTRYEFFPKVVETAY